jgi:hypothetical protein
VTVTHAAVLSPRQLKVPWAETPMYNALCPSRPASGCFSSLPCAVSSTCDGAHPRGGLVRLAFGVILLTAAIVLWSRRVSLAADSDGSAGDRLLYVRRLSAPLSVFAAGLGLDLFGIAAAGWRYTLFAAPRRARRWRSRSQH